MLIDSHAHLTSSEVLPHLSEMLERAQSAHISHILNICTDAKSLNEGILLSQKSHLVKNAGATTPHDVKILGDREFPLFAQAAREGKLAAIGETGLDYYYEDSPKSLQKKFLEKYLALAQETELHVIFHCREAFDDLFSISDQAYQGHPLLHCFTGSMQDAKEVLKRGWYVSFSGIVTFKKSEALREIVKIVPLSQLLIETDTPYLAPQSKRGHLNEPSFLQETAACLAQIKEISIELLSKAISDNAKKLFGF